MIQPINGRLLVAVADSQYKHVTLNTDKKYQLAVNTGVVLSVSDDLEIIIRGALKLKENEWVPGLPKPSELVGKTVSWDKYVEQNSMMDIDDADNPGSKIKVALIGYKDITSYAG